MVAICHDDPISQDREIAPDRLRRVVHALLALYLLPAFLLVMLVGGVLLTIQGLCRAIAWTGHALGRLRIPSETPRDDPSRAPRGRRQLAAAALRVGSRSSRTPRI